MKGLAVELRPREDGSFDELLADNVKDIHAEMMSKNALWIGVYGDAGKRWSIWIRAEKGKLSVNAFEDG